MSMDITLKNYANLIGKNWIEPAIQNSACEIEKVTEEEKEYGWDCAYKYYYKDYYVSSLLNNDKYKIRISIPEREDKKGNKIDGYVSVEFEAYSLNSFLKKGHEAIETDSIILETEEDCLKIQEQLESWLSKKTTTTKTKTTKTKTTK